MSNSLYGRARRFAFILYGEEEFPYVKEFLFLILNPQAMVVSPRHPNGGDNKGFHYHVYVRFDHYILAETVRRRLDIFPISKVFPVKNPKALIRYFCHYDSPEKGIQFNPSELSVFGDIYINDIKKYFN